MGSSARERPIHLPAKLKAIRDHLGLSQTDMGVKLGLEQPFARNYVSGYERGTREPILKVLLAYARAAGVSTDVLIDDELKLPKSFQVR